MISSESEDEAQGAAAAIDWRAGPVAWRRCDVTRPGDQQALVEETASRFGRLDIVVANAGISGPMTGTTGAPPAEHRAIMDVNLDSVVELCRLSIPHLVQQGGGSILLMSSIAGLRGNSSLGSYALSKAALAQLARNLAVEHGPDNIRANAIAPGFIRTDLAAPLIADPSFMARRMRNTPLRRPGEPIEVAGAALFLASKAGAFITGHTLVVDGGTLITDGN
jgi:NAD(P)-dependent dehydrogenase (short-subunit alcohol dehydrogenase family)